MVEDAEVLDFFVGAGVLGAELVAGEGEDFEVAGVGGLEVLIIPLARWQYVLVLGLPAYPCKEPRGCRAAA